MELPVLATACHVWVATPIDYAQPHSMEVGMMLATSPTSLDPIMKVPES